MKIRILVLNSDSLAASSISDDRISHGFILNSHMSNIKDFLASAKFNNLLSLPACLSKHINLADALFNEDSLLKACDFYTMEDGANFDIKYVKDHFDYLLFLFHDALDDETRFNESLLTMLSTADCPNFGFFNLQISKDTWDDFNKEHLSERFYLLNYFLSKILPKAQFVTLSNVEQGLSDGKYIDKEQYLAFFEAHKLIAPAFYYAINGYSLFNTHKVAQSLVRSENLFKSLPKLDEAPKNIVISSSLFTHHLVFNMSPYAGSLLRTIHELFPKSHLILLLDQAFYSYLGKLEPFNVITKSASQDSFNSVTTLPNELSDDVVLLINEYVTNLIKVELFQEQENLPEFPLSLSGAYYDFDLDLKVKEYSKLISQCFISVDDEDFLRLNPDLVISDSAYEQRLALNNGIALLPLTNDLNLEEEASDQYYATYVAGHFDFLDILLEKCSLQYPNLQAQGMMSYFPKVGSYGSNLSHALYDSSLFKGLSLQKFLANPCDSLSSFKVSPNASELLQKDRTLLLDLLRTTITKTHELSVSCPATAPSQASLQGLTMSQGQAMAPSHAHDDGDSLGQSSKAECSSIEQGNGEQCVGKSDRAERSLGGHEALNKIAQLSNYTNSKRYGLQWQFLNYFAWQTNAHDKNRVIKSNWQQAMARYEQEPSLFKPNCFKILSFGCSRGQEVCDLLRMFNHQYITGADISHDALAAARKLKDNLLCSEQLGSCVPDSNNEFFAKTSDDYALVSYLGHEAQLRFIHSSELITGEQYDVVCAMTVLCHHPETVGAQDISKIYPFADFENLLVNIDSLVKTGGLLCLFNANYRLEDSVVSSKYIKLFPCEDGDMTAMPQELRDLYNKSSAFDKTGYVSKFQPSGLPLGSSSIGTIFKKIASN